MKRIAMAGIAGAVVLVVWGALVHMALGIDEYSMRVPPDASQDRILATLGAELDEPAVYMLPMLQREQWSDEAAQVAFAEKQRSTPYAWIVYQPRIVPFADGFPTSIGKQFLTMLVAALLAAWVVSLTALGYGGRALLVAALGLFAWLTTHVPLWNWYRFPFEYTMGAFIECVVGWLLAGLVIAAIVKPRRSGVY